MTQDSVCQLCDGTFIICIAGPDYWGNYETDDCPCQFGYSREEIDRMADKDESCR